MKNWFRKLNERLDRWMSVRYGHDEFGAVLLGLGVFFYCLPQFPTGNMLRLSLLSQRYMLLCGVFPKTSNYDVKSWNFI